MTLKSYQVIGRNPAGILTSVRPAPPTKWHIHSKPQHLGSTPTKGKIFLLRVVGSSTPVHVSLPSGNLPSFPHSSDHSAPFGMSTREICLCVPNKKHIYASPTHLPCFPNIVRMSATKRAPYLPGHVAYSSSCPCTWGSRSPGSPSAMRRVGSNASRIISLSK